MGSDIAKLFIDPSTLPGGKNCVAPAFPCPDGVDCFAPGDACHGYCRLSNGDLYLLNSTIPGNSTAQFISSIVGTLTPEQLASADIDDYCGNKFGGFFQLLLLLAVYGYVLFWSSNQISDGSELLMFIPTINKDLVGSVVLPILGAVPDGMIVLFSGLGDIHEAQQQLDVGVGALAGSTIMLLTIPWFLSLYGGLVDLVEKNGVLVGDYPDASNRVDRRSKGTWSVGYHLSRAGVEVNPIIRKNAKLMLVTGIPCYMVIQFPAFEFPTSSKLADIEHPFAIVGLVMTIVLFLYYLWFQANNDDNDSKFDRLLHSWLDGTTELEAPLSQLLCKELKGLHDLQEQVSQRSTMGQGLEEGLIQRVTSDTRAGDMERLQKLLLPVFRKYDVDSSGYIDHLEFDRLMQSIGENVSHYLPDATGSTAQLYNQLFAKYDSSHDNRIDFDEFVTMFYDQASVYATRPPAYWSNQEKKKMLQRAASNAEIGAVKAADEDPGDDDDDDDEELLEGLYDVGDDGSKVLDLPRLKRRSAFKMFIGTAVVLLFSDPMVDVMGALGDFIGISGFYVSFVLAPLASNASELIAALAFASKKTKDSITTSLSTLLGAACMNNTFCLAIFLALIVFRYPLKWTFSAETISILFVEIVMFFFAIRRVMPMRDMIFVVMLFPISIVLVAVLENVAGLD